MIRLYTSTSPIYPDKKGISGHAMFAFQEGPTKLKYQLSFKQSSIKIIVFDTVLNLYIETRQIGPLVQ